MKTNFKRLVSVAVVLIMIVTLFTGCGKESTVNSLLGDPFVPIEGQEANGLVYHHESKTVYVLFGTSSIGGFSYGYLSEYIVNGHNCEYMDNRIVEVVPNYEYVDGKIVETQPSYVEVAKVEVDQTADEKWDSLTKEEKEALLAKQ